MNRKLLGISLAAVFAVSMMGVSYAAPDWLGFSAGSQSVTEKGKTSTLSLIANNTVPRQTSDLAGFAWIYDNAALNATVVDAFAITIHSAPTLLDDDSYNEIRDSTQNPDNWHPHNVILNATNGSGNADLCVVDLSDAPTAGIAIDEDTDVVKVNVRNAVLADSLSATPAVAAFEIVVANNCWAPTIGTESYGDANEPVGPVSLGIKFTQAHFP
jgi:hypothetical protein